MYKKKNKSRGRPHTKNSYKISKISILMLKSFNYLKVGIHIFIMFILIFKYYSV